jgi:putative Mg2+ transporter-C (MgtC) family protein
MPVSLDNTAIVLRLGLAFVFGAALGVERELRGQAAGLRTHLLVCLGACLFTVAGLYAGLEFEGHTGGYSGGGQDPIRADITRVASQVVVGIGFLGGGAIVRHGTSVHGLTTAANLWLTASVGLATGLGFYPAAVATVVFALVVLVVLRPVERFLLHLRKRLGLQKEEYADSPPPHE